MADDVLVQRARALAVRPVVQTAAVPRAIAVAIGEQRYAFPVDHVRKVAVTGAIARLPHVPPLVLGLGSVDGEVLAIFDARIWCGLPGRARGGTTNVILLGTGAPLALAVDAIAGTLELAAIEPLPDRRWLSGATPDGVLVVDIPALLVDPAFSGATT